MKQRVMLIAGMWAAGHIALAQPPEVTGLYPAGGQRGTEVRVTVQGKIDPAATQLWTDRPGLELAGLEAPNVLKLKIAADAPRGTTWLRLFTADGASVLKPFLTGATADVLEQEPNDTLPKAHVVAAMPVTVNGTLEKSGDVDTFRIALQAGETLVASLAARQSLGSPMDGLLQIVDAQGFVREQNDDQRGFDPRLVFTAPRAGDYTVRVFAFPAQPDTTVRFAGGPNFLYRLTLTTGPWVDRLLPCAVLAQQPAKVRPLGWNLTASTGTIDVGPFARGIVPVFPEGLESSARVFISQWPVNMEQEPNPLTQPQRLTSPTVACGEIGTPKDVDAWKFTAQAGQKLSFRLMAVSLGSALDAVLRIHDSMGQKTAEIDDAVQEEADAVLEFTAAKAGDYTITITDRFGHGGPGYGYALSVTEPRPVAVLQVTTDNHTVKGDAALEIPVTIERRSGFALPVMVSADGLPDGVMAAVVLSEPQGDSSKQVKLVVKSTRTEKWSGPMRIIGRVEGDPSSMQTAVMKHAGTEEWLPHLWLTAVPK